MPAIPPFKLRARKSSKMKVSVAMCTYNGESYLQEQLDSLAEQTRLPLELVVCDDGSTDSTYDILSRFSKVAPFSVRCYRNSNNIGSTANFSRAIALCRAELIALCDQDDLWKKEKLERQVLPFLESSEVGGSFCDGELIDASSRPIGLSLWSSLGFTSAMQKQVASGSSTVALAHQNFVTGAALIFRSELRSRFTVIPQYWVHDAWIAWMISIYSQLHMVPDRLLAYRVHPNQQIGVNLPSTVALINRDASEVIGRLEEELRRMMTLEKAICEDGSLATAASKRLIMDKVRFIEARINLSRKSKVLRGLHIIPEIGSYRRFTKGWRSIAGDILL